MSTSNKLWSYRITHDLGAQTNTMLAIIYLIEIDEHS